MTKKTNALLFRVGINSLWNYKKANFKNAFNEHRLEKILFNELINHNWNILSIKKNEDKIIIQVYATFEFYKNFKRKIFIYYKKFKSINKISEKFSLNNQFLTEFMLKTKWLYRQLNTYSFKISSFFIFVILKKKLKLMLLINFFLYLVYFTWFSLVLILNVYLEQKKLLKTFDSFYVNHTFVLSKLRKINGFIYFKVLSLFCEGILFKCVNKKIKIHFNNVWHSKGWFFKKIGKYINKDLFKILFLACVYNNVKIFSDCISLMLRKNKNHVKVLRQIIRVIETFWQIKQLSIRGIKLKVQGKLNGRMRKSKYNYNIGKVQLQELQVFLNYNMSISYTKFGIMAIKLWLLHGITKI